MTKLDDREEGEEDGEDGEDGEENGEQASWPWPPPKDSLAYGDVGTQKYRDKVKLQDWLEELAEAGGYNNDNKK